MQATDIMTTDVATVSPSTTIKEIAKLLLERRISGVPVIDATREVLGIVSEGDLIRRVETDTETRGSWWLKNFGSRNELQKLFIKSHGLTAEKVMTAAPITVSRETSINEIASILEKNGIKRVPVVDDGKLVGIISRANLLHGLASSTIPRAPTQLEDQSIREAVATLLSKTPGLQASSINVLVDDGKVDLWGYVETDTEESAIVIATQGVPGVKNVQSHIGRSQGWWWGI